MHLVAMTAREQEEKWKHLASKSRNLTVQFPFPVEEPASVTVTGRGGVGAGILSSLRLLGADSAIGVVVSKATSFGDAATAALQLHSSCPGCRWRHG